MPYTVIDGRGDLHASCKDADLWQSVFLADYFTERVVNREELARIRKELDEIAKRAA